MNGITDLDELLSKLKPVLRDGEYAFVTVPEATYGAHAELNPVAVIAETEGLTLVVPAELAAAAGMHHDGTLRMISLSVHSSLHAVGLTAAVARALANRGISANMIAAFHHDHVFVPADRADEALEVLNALSAA